MTVNDGRPPPGRPFICRTQVPARQNLCYCERALPVRFPRLFSLRMNNYVPLMSRENALDMARSRYADFCRAST